MGEVPEMQGLGSKVGESGSGVDIGGVRETTGR